MNTQVLKTLVVAVTLTISSLAMANDLGADLKTPFEAMTNPFNNTQEVALDANTAAVVKNLLQQCAYTPVSKDPKGFQVFGESVLRPECASDITVKYDKDNKGAPYISNEMYIHADGLSLWVISWDGSDSDGGDEQAIGIYDIQGNRVAVYPTLYVDGNVLDGIGHAVNAAIPQVQK